MIKKGKDMNNPTASKRALDTIKLIGNQVIEIREILNKQHEMIQRLEKEVIRMKSVTKDGEQNIKILQLDQRDILRQVRKLKEGNTVFENVVDQTEEINDEAADILFNEEMQIDGPDKLNHVDDLLSYDEQEIGSKFYPNYKRSKVVANNEKAPKPQRQNQTQQRPQNQKQVKTNKANFKPISKQEMNKRIDSRVEMLQEEVKNRVKKADKLAFDRIPRLLNLD